MDKASSVLAAINAGKQPTQQQTSAWIDRFLASPLIQIEGGDGGGLLSDNGKKLAQDIRSILEAYNTYAAHKNSDDQFQEALWHLRKAEIADTSLDVDVPADKQDAKRDTRAIASSLRTSLEVLWTSATAEGSGVFSDFTSFARLTLADTAELFGEKANQAADSLRNVEEEVQQGGRNVMGVKSQTEEQIMGGDARAKFELGMDTAKEYGSSVIGVGQDASATAKDVANKSGNRLREAAGRIAKRAQEDNEYRQSLEVIFDLLQKWVNVTGDAAANVTESTSLESLINDPTPDQHLIKALRCIRQLAENVAGGMSMDGPVKALQACVVDIREDADIQGWVTDFLAYLKKNMQSIGQADSKETEEERLRLKRRWVELTDANSPKGKKWKDDASVFRNEMRAFQRRMDNDPDLQAVRKAHYRLGTDLEETLVDVTALGVQSSIDNAAWLWQDLFNAYIPRFLGMLKHVPIPRTEYKDPETEFVLENLDISSLSLLPGHAYIRNITDVDITAPENGPATTSVGSLTHVHLKGLQMKLEEISFYYLDKTAALGPSEFKGIVGVTLPPQGIDIDIKFRLLPSSPEGLKQRQQSAAYHRVERVDVSINEDTEFVVKESNHPVLLTVFKPILNSRLRNTLQTVLREQVRSVLESVDSIMYDVAERTQVFADAGVSRGPALSAAFWSELGRLQRLPGGLMSGWRATGTGLVKEMGDSSSGAALAMGAEPQILSPEQRGPIGTMSEPLADKTQRVVREGAEQMDVDVHADASNVRDQAKEGVEEVRKATKEGIRQVRAFKELVEEKQAVEAKKEGWKSDAFDA
ncbi:hypothetical protein OF83DRAFT_1240205 [Amylostereum chailletii]|nr:hypothetical protein OF83DRAFT_1240205 [Amylostereum chailletii]